MAKKKKEEPKVDNEVGSLKVKEKVEKQPDGNETKGNVTKVKEKMKMKLKKIILTKEESLRMFNPRTPGPHKNKKKYNRKQKHKKLQL